MANQTNLIITAKSRANKNVTTSITYINPNATNEKLKELAEKLNALTTNSITVITKITKEVVV